MVPAKLDCAHCKKSAMVMPARKGFPAVIRAAYDLGWIRRDGEWYCGKECIAISNKDMTPLRKQITT